LLDLLADGIANARVLLLINYRPEYRHEWGNKSYYMQLRLDALGRESAAEMLSTLLGDGVELDPLKRMVIERTEGNPFFIEEMVQALFDEGAIVRGDPHPGPLPDTLSWRADAPPSPEKEAGEGSKEGSYREGEGSKGREQRIGAVKVARSLAQLRLPSTVQGILASRIDRLPVEEKELLQTLAVMGRESPLGLVRRVWQHPHPRGAASAERGPNAAPLALSRDPSGQGPSRAGSASEGQSELERMLSDLQAGEFIYEQPATGDIEYVFKHALTQDVAYNSLLIERRKLLHYRIGDAIESLYASSLDDHLAKLAHHYSHSDNVTKAVAYLGRAGQQAIRRSAYADAISGLTAAIDLLQKVPDSPEYIQRELPLQLALGPALIAVKGWAAPETERAYTRARGLCERLGDPPALFPTLAGLWVVYLVRGELRTAYELAERLLWRAQGAHDPALLASAHRYLGITTYCMGEFLLAREHLEIPFSPYDPERDGAPSFGLDAGLICLSFGAWTLWQLGYPDQALKRGNEALALAQRLSHPFSLAFAGIWLGVVHQYRLEARAAQKTAEDAIALCAEHGFSEYSAWATCLRGWAMAEQARHEGIAQVQEGLAAYRATGAELWRPYFLCPLAEACRETGRLEDGLSALTEALATVDEHENRIFEPEMHRLKGEQLLRQNNSNIAAAQSCFEQAIAVARKQSAKSLELRATNSLARLLDKQGRREEARAMLAEIYNWFTEGFDTADLKDAKALLDGLSIV
jgi:predicted ATPase